MAWPSFLRTWSNLEMISVVVPLNFVSSSASVLRQVVAPKLPVAAILVSCVTPPELPKRIVNKPPFRLAPRETSDHSPITVLSLLIVPRNTFVKLRPRCHCRSAGNSLSRLIPAHQRVFDDRWT